MSSGTERHFSQSLRERIQAGQPPAVIGLDPRIEALPKSLIRSEPVLSIRDFYRQCLPLLSRHVPVVKPNIAYFERYGAAGYAVYEEVCRWAKQCGLLVIGDIKRGDIGATAAAYADGHLPLVDALTVHPYLGTDSIQPFLDGCRAQGKGLFVLVRTSNPSAAELQSLKVGNGDLSAAVAFAVDRWGESCATEDGEYHLVGAVVGATYAEDITRLRRIMPRSWFLLPGIGAQGATVEDVAAAFDENGLGALVSSSRGVMQAFDPADPDWLDKVEEAAAGFAAQIQAVIR